MAIKSLLQLVSLIIQYILDIYLSNYTLLSITTDISNEPNQCLN